MAPRPPLGLSVIAKDAAGNETIWWSGDRFPYNRPQGLTFATRRGEGFSEASCTLARDIRGEYVDLSLLGDVTFVGDEGSIAYEGRLQSTPRTFDSAQGHSISPAWVGWMTHAQDRTFSEVYVDRDLSKWGPASVQRRINLVGSASITPMDSTVLPDVTTGAPSLAEEIQAATYAAVGKPTVEGWYDAGPGLLIGSIYYAWKINSLVGSADTNYFWNMIASSDDIATAIDDSGNLRAAGPGTGTLTTTGGNKRFALARILYNAAVTFNANPGIYWTCLAVYGTHGLTKQGTASATDAQGFYLSDILTDICQRFCPKLSVDGVAQNSTLISHWTAANMTPFDAFQDLNKYALWNLAVWEGKTLNFEQADLTDYDWEVRLSDPGTSTSLQGDDAADLRNGVVVVYDDVQLGISNTLTPDDYDELRDDSPTNPANVAGIDKWGPPYELSVPCTQEMALQFGQMVLADSNQAKEAGTVTVQGHIRDRAGHWRPAWQVRAGDTVAITDFPNARPRLIVETSYSHDDHTLNISVDSSFHALDAIIDRLTLAKTTASL